MAAHPPFRQRRRPRPGSLNRPVNSRMYRGTWLLVGIPLLISAFTVSHPQPLRAPTLQPDFDGAAAVLTDELRRTRTPTALPARSARDRPHPGSPAVCAVRPAHPARAFSRENPRPRQRAAREPARVPRRDGRTRSSSCSHTATTAARAQARTTTAPEPQRSSSWRARTRRLRPRRGRPSRITRSCSCPRTEGRSEASERRISRSTRRYMDRVVAAVDLDSIAGERPPTPRFRRRRPAVRCPRARTHRRRTSSRADRHPGYSPGRSRAAPRPRLSAEPVRAGALRRRRHRSDRPHVGRRSPAAGRWRHRAAAQRQAPDRHRAVEPGAARLPRHGGRAGARAHPPTSTSARAPSAAGPSCSFSSRRSCPASPSSSTCSHGCGAGTSRSPPRCGATGAGSSSGFSPRCSSRPSSTSAPGRRAQRGRWRRSSRPERTGRSSDWPFSRAFSSSGWFVARDRLLPRRPARGRGGIGRAQSLRSSFWRCSRS